MSSLRPLLVAVLCLLSACASNASSSTEGAPVRGDSRTITSTELESATQLNLYDFLAAQRPRWLEAQRPTGNAVVVFMDDARLGGVSTLRSVTLSQVVAVRYYDTSAAQQKFTGRIVGPVIHVATK